MDFFLRYYCGCVAISLAVWLTFSEADGLAIGGAGELSALSREERFCQTFVGNWGCPSCCSWGCFHRACGCPECSGPDICSLYNDVSRCPDCVMYSDHPACACDACKPEPEHDFCELASNGTLECPSCCFRENACKHTLCACAACKPTPEICDIIADGEYSCPMCCQSPRPCRLKACTCKECRRRISDPVPPLICTLIKLGHEECPACCNEGCELIACGCDSCSRQTKVEEHQSTQLEPTGDIPVRGAAVFSVNATTTPEARRAEVA